MSTTNSGQTRTLFITPQYLKANSFPNENVDDKLLKKAIRVAEDKYIKPIIGGSLYYAIISKIDSNTLAGDYKNLLDNFITPCLVEYAIYEYIPYTFKYRNKGIMKQGSENAEPAELNELYYQRDNVRDTAQFYAEELIRFLKANTTSFIEYGQYSQDQIAPARGDYFSGIHVPGANRGNGGFYNCNYCSGNGCNYCRGYNY